MTQLLPRLVATILNREAIQNLGSAWQNLVPNLTRIESDSDSIRFVFAIRQRAPPAAATSASGYTSIKLQSTNHSVQAVTMAAQRAGNWEQNNLLEATQNLNRFPIQIRRDQARQQSSAGTARTADLEGGEKAFQEIAGFGFGENVFSNQNAHEEFPEEAQKLCVGDQNLGMPLFEMIIRVGFEKQ